METTQQTQAELLARQHEIIQQSRQHIQALSARLDQPIAIVGMACRMPGADSPAALWSLLSEGREAISEVPPDRWDIDEYYGPVPGTPYKTYARRAGYLPDADRFDAKFFGISPREAQQMDPQQRLLLEVSHEALEQALLPAGALRGQPVGVFVGISSSEYAVMSFSPEREASQDAYSITGTSMNSAAGRLAYHYGFNGPALAIDTACSSSLVAIYQACRSLVNDECHTALAGGVNVLLTPEPSIALAQNKVLSASGRCSPFSAAADGLVRGEGCGLLVLKRLSDAVAENCPVLAVIRAGHVNQDGASSGLTVPNGHAQQALIAAALKKARVAPAAVRYVEAHGTGTSLGDPIEAKALQQALCAGQDRHEPLRVGSIKAHIGHLEAASGVAGVIKVVLALQHRLLPAQINLGQRTPHVDWNAGLEVVDRPVALQLSPETPYYAGVSSFGFSGTNAHLILQDACSAVPARGPAPQQPAAAAPVARWLTVSAKSPTALQALLARHRDFFARESAWADACEALNAGRTHYPYRAGFVATDRDTLLQQLDAACRAAPAEPVSALPAMAWLFTGQGSQYVQMGRALHDTQPAFRALLEDCDRELARHLGHSILPVIWGEAPSLHATGHTQPAIFCLQYALSQFLQTLGLQPQFVLGHSIGEYAAAVLAGVFDLQDAARMIVYRGRLMEQRCASGRMLVVFADRERAEALVRASGGEAAIAVINGPTNHVLSGTPASIERLARLAEDSGLRCVPLSVSHAFHSPMMAPMLGEFEQVVRQTRFARPRIGFLSSALGRVADVELTDPAYWVSHVSGAVRFEQAVAALAGSEDWTAAPGRLALEIGPYEQLVGMAKLLPGADRVQWRGLLRPRDDLSAFADTLRCLYLSGLPLNWPRPVPQDPPRLSWPLHPFERERHWLPDVQRGASAADRDYSIDWIEATPAAPARPLEKRWLLLVEDAAFAGCLSQGLAAAGGVVQTLSVDRLPEALEVAGIDAVIYSPSEPAGLPDPERLHGFLRLVQRLAPDPGGPGPRLYCVVASGSDAYPPLASCLASLCRSLREEEAGLPLTLIGLDLRHAAAPRAAALLAEIGIERGEDWERRWVDGEVQVPRLVERRVTARPGAASVRADRSYLVTGGTGALGRLLAQALIELGARDVVLAARRDTEAGLAPLRALAAAQGARLTVLRTDMSEGEAVRRLFERLARDHAPLAGIVHAAGRLADVSFRQMQAADFADAFGAKAGGAWWLDRLSADCDLDFFLMVSSIAAVFGAAGQANYAAANGFLDALAVQRRAAGRPALSLRLGAVAGTGMAAGEAALRQLQRAGVLPLDPARLRSRCVEWLTAAEPLPIWAGFDWPRILARQAVARPLLAAFVPQPATQPTSAAQAPARFDPDSVGQLLRDTLASILAMPDPQSIQDGDTLHALGMDSVTLVELCERLAPRLGCEVPTRLLFDFPQVGALARQLQQMLGTGRTSPAPGETALQPAAAADIAVVGMGCRFPGGANSPEGFWSMLLDGRDLIGEIDALRWNAPQLVQQGALATARAGVIDAIDVFDCGLFGIAPREAHCMDPQQRLLLEVSWEALERAGYDFAAGPVRGGVFVGPGPNDYARRFSSDAEALSHHHGTGNALSVTAGRLAFLLDWQGPALAVDTACSSSLMAVHLALQSLRRGECDIALAGGVNLLLSPETSVLLSKGNMLAPDGRCKSFDAAADGYVRSEGCGMVVLKRLDDALADGDSVLAVLRGSAVNQDGHSQGLTAPNGQAQQRVLRQALADARVDPAQVELLEAHGTGTPLGDPIEIAAAHAVYVEDTGRATPLWVSSVKTNIGHAETAAGIAGLIKAVLCLQHGMIVPHLHFQRLNPEIRIDAAQLRIPVRAQSWQGEGPRYAALSSFGFSGTNVHLVLQSAPLPAAPPVGAEPPAGLRISAASAAALVDLMRAYRDALADLPPEHYREFRLQTWRRAELGHTRVLDAATPAAAVAALDEALALSGPAAARRSSWPASGRGRVPTYVFERQRFWIDPPAPAPRPALPGLRLGPKEAPKVTYVLDYSGQPPFRLQDHLVHGQPVVPAAAHLALIIGMLDDLRGRQAWQLVDVLCEEPLVVEEADSGAVRYQFRLASDGGTPGYSIEVLSDVPGRTRRHLRAQARASTGGPTALVAPPSQGALARIEGRAFYERLYAPEIRLAGSFRGITSIDQHVGHTVAQLAWTFHPEGRVVPGELDSLLQTIALATLAEEPERSHMGGATIPLAIERLTVGPRTQASATGQGVSVTRLVKEDAQASTFVHDLTLSEPGRPPFLSIEGLLTRRVGERDFSAPRQAAPSPYYLIESWTTQAATPAQPASAEPVLVRLNPEDDGASLWQPWQVQTGAWLDAGGCDDDAVLQALGGRPARLLYHLPAVAGCEADAPPWSEQALALVAAARRAFRLGEVLAAAGHQTGFWVVSQGHADVAGQGGSPLYGLAQGLCKSLSLEWPGRVVGMLDTDTHTLQREVRALLTECRALRGDWVAYREGRRHVLRVQELVAPPLSPGQGFRCRDDGVYLLTGGLGDLAVETCHWLARQGARHLVLLGRRALDARLSEQLDRLRQATGAHIDYQACDVADRAALGGLFERVLRERALRGIFHCAGVLADGAFAALDDAQFQAVLQAKVLGSWNLHRLSLGLELDCFVMYSSLASLLGAAGQSNYAAANGFMDQLAQWRRHQGLPALSINWGGWDEVGMAARQTSRSGGQGLRRLPVARALADLQRALLMDPGRLGVIDVDWPVFAGRWRDTPPALVEQWVTAHAAQARATPDAPAPEVAAELRRLPALARPEAVKRQLRQIARQVMSLDASRELPDDKPFHELGFDSVMSIELKLRVQELFRIRVPASVVFDHPDIHRLAAYIAQALELEAPPPVRPAASLPAEALDDLDEDQLADLLDNLL
ncbi:SDR family NAD(P)-dependent oxidoreductase [Aquabacterium sp. A7-Y]|uniref:type I polyketide synthase n=1 Tax=Aquabacterium sp. A7-Y TaxID=1349605 RepID=UPI00223D8A13|nr:type I polyketide synthase [Aquabacterium sp. A7-Y]MCW7538527.1 SDR family NAD(P)-dependent oxidoreductase [Aquabacterium sp. A7-Y]